MNEDIKKSKFLSLVLRHKPEEIGVKLDPNGWVSILELLKKTDWKWSELDAVVKNNNKQRFEYDEKVIFIRARQGHSVMVDLGYEAVKPPDVLYHGTNKDAAVLIKRDGLKKMQRHHVHLSVDEETAYRVGRRSAHIPVILKIDAKKMHEDGCLFYLSNNGVWLTEYVDSCYIKWKAKEI
jgi:putative RNA 2'-phosphotransferase